MSDKKNITGNAGEAIADTVNVCDSERLIITPKWLDGVNDDLGEDFVKPFLNDGEKQITLHELLVRASLSHPDTTENISKIAEGVIWNKEPEKLPPNFNSTVCTPTVVVRFPDGRLVFHRPDRI
jgi:hypothetical protein